MKISKAENYIMGTSFLKKSHSFTNKLSRAKRNVSVTYYDIKSPDGIRWLDGTYYFDLSVFIFPKSGVKIENSMLFDLCWPFSFPGWICCLYHSFLLRPIFSHLSFLAKSLTCAFQCIPVSELFLSCRSVGFFVLYPVTPDAYIRILYGHPGPYFRYLYCSLEKKFGG